ncbi:MAG: DUF1549 and DUF1553 domain-containing protein [Verrucomicrobiales bacterium]
MKSLPAQIRLCSFLTLWLPFGGLSAAEGEEVFDWNAERAHWAYQPIKIDSSVELLPYSAAEQWVRRPLDRLVWRKLLEQKLEPAAEASPGTLLRRVTFDLSGLPATYAEIQAMEEAPDPQEAYSDSVERLLHSPHFGERLASMWLNVARYAEDQAHQVGEDTAYFYPNAHLFRQWVVDAFNSDMPYDEFVRYQLAADLLGPDGEKNLVALGFLGLGPKYYNRGRLEVQAEEWEDRVDTVTRGLLAMTVACARCHDHKNDAITMKDYYGLAGVFASTEMWNRGLPGAVPGRDKDGKEEALKLVQTMHVVKEGSARDLNVFERGDVTRKGEVAPRRFLRVLCDSEPPSFAQGDGKGSGRLELAQAITGQSKELSARVFVNRIWGVIVGKPLVTTPSNFGKLGARPSNQDLLDFLAADFLKNRSSVKHLVREIVMSATYRQSADASAEKVAQDPGNDFLSRMNRRRLSAEMLRDSVLAVTGELEFRGGASTDVSDSGNFRRTLYGRVSRKELDAYLAQFDYPDANVHCAARALTTTPAQKLFLLNSGFVLERAEKLADQVLAGYVAMEDQIDDAYARILARRPDADERDIARNFLKQHGAADRERWVQFTQALLVSNEFLYRD